jgi:hypothetical protein
MLLYEGICVIYDITQSALNVGCCTLRTRTMYDGRIWYQPSSCSQIIDIIARWTTGQSAGNSTRYLLDEDAVANLLTGLIVRLCG